MMPLPQDALFGCLTERAAAAVDSDAAEALFWHEAFQRLAAVIAAGTPERLAVRGLREWCQVRRQQLGKPSARAMEVHFYRTRQRWEDGGRTPEALLDRRPAANASRRAPSLPQTFRDRLTARAVFACGGRVAQAYREAINEGELPPELAARYLANPSRKSYVPAAIRRQVQAEVEMLGDHHRGPRTARLNGADIQRDWSKVAAGDWYQSDDCTLPVYYWVPGGDGGFTLTRGQFLPLIDLRSRRVLDFVLLDSKSYNAAAIRTLIVRGCDRFGLPRRGFQFENGMWRTARLLKGDRHASPHSEEEVELGLRSLGLEFTHAKDPKGKPVEGVLGQLQNLMEGEPGYVGRDEVNDKFERVQKAKLAVESGKTLPWEAGFRSADQWFDRLHDLVAAYNGQPQEGVMIDGLSPDEAWQAHYPANNPPVRLMGFVRYLLSTHKRPVTVTRNGVRLPFGKMHPVYRSKETGALIGQRMLAWYDPEAPESICLTDMNRDPKSLICVPRAPVVPAMDAPREEMEDAKASVAAQNSYGRARYSQLKALWTPPERQIVADVRTVELGQRMQEAKETAKAEARRDQVDRRQAADLARRHGLPDPVTPELREGYRALEILDHDDP